MKRSPHTLTKTIYSGRAESVRARRENYLRQQSAQCAPPNQSSSEMVKAFGIAREYRGRFARV